MDFSREDGDSVVSLIRLNIQRLQQQVRELESLVSRVRENDTTRELFNNLAAEANNLAKETNRGMQKLVSMSNTDRGMRVHRELLSDEFMKILNRLQSAQRRAEKAQKEGIKQARNAANEEDEAIRRSEEESELARVQRLKLGPSVMEEYKERAGHLAQLSQDIEDVNTIFADLARIVHDQGEMVDSIEENVENANLHVESGRVNLQQAVYYQTQARKKKLMLLVFLIIFMMIIGLTVYFYAK